MKELTQTPKEELIASLQVLEDFTAEMKEAPMDFLQISERLLPELVELAKSL